MNFVIVHMIVFVLGIAYSNKLDFNSRNIVQANYLTSEAPVFHNIASLMLTDFLSSSFILTLYFSMKNVLRVKLN